MRENLSSAQKAVGGVVVIAGILMSMYLSSARSSEIPAQQCVECAIALREKIRTTMDLDDINMEELSQSIRPLANFTGGFYTEINILYQSEQNTLCNYISINALDFFDVTVSQLIENARITSLKDAYSNITCFDVDSLLMAAASSTAWNAVMKLVKNYEVPMNTIRVDGNKTELDQFYDMAKSYESRHQGETNSIWHKSIRHFRRERSQEALKLTVGKMPRFMCELDGTCTAKCPTYFQRSDIFPWGQEYGESCRE